MQLTLHFSDHNFSQNSYYLLTIIFDIILLCNFGAGVGTVSLEPVFIMVTPLVCTKVSTQLISEILLPGCRKASAYISSKLYTVTFA